MEKRQQVWCFRAEAVSRTMTPPSAGLPGSISRDSRKIKIGTMSFMKYLLCPDSFFVCYYYSYFRGES